MTQPPVHTSSTRSINKAIAAAGIKHITLQSGRGYQYLVFNDGNFFDTRSEYVNRVCDLSVAQWVDLAVDFAGICPE